MNESSGDPNSDRFAADIMPVTEAIRAEGVTSLYGIARELDRRGKHGNTDGPCTGFCGDGAGTDRPAPLLDTGWRTSRGNAGPAVGVG